MISITPSNWLDFRVGDLLGRKIKFKNRTTKRTCSGTIVRIALNACIVERPRRATLYVVMIEEII